MATEVNQEKRLVEETRALIEEVEAGNTTHAAWVAIQDRVKRLYDGRTQAEVGELLEKPNSWIADLLKWEPARRPTPFGGGYRATKQRDEVGARSALRDPQKRQRVIASLDADEIEAVIEVANDAAIERVRAKHAEHQTEPTAGEIMGDDKFDPAEYWADTLIIRVNGNARELASLINRAGGLLFGTMPPEEAFDYLHEAERLIAEARAAAQEQVRDKTEVV